MTSLSSSPAGSALFQSLPFRTNFHGTTDIHENFTAHTQASTAAEGGAALLHNRFRGRALTGVDVPMPPGYHVALIDFASEGPTALSTAAGAAGAVGGDQPLNAPHTRGVVCADTITLVASSPHYIIWEHDRVPDPRAVAALAQWVDLAATIHSVDEEAEAATA